MKKNLLIKTLILMLLFIGANQISAQRLITENFDYELGDLSGQGSWVGTNSATGNPLQVVNKQLTYPGYQDAPIGYSVELKDKGEDAIKSFETQESGFVYASILINFSEVQSSNSTGDYFFHFGENTNATIYSGRVMVKKNTDGTKMLLGIARSGTSSLAVWDSNEYELNTTHLIVLKYEIIEGEKNDKAYLFVNPAISTTEPTPSVSSNAESGAEIAKAGAIAIRQGATSRTPLGHVGVLRVSKTWAGLFDSEAPVTPAITLDNGYLSYGNVFQGETYTKTVNVKGENLKGDITIAGLVSGEITPSVTTITKEQASAAEGYDVVFTFKPQNEEIYSEEILFETEGMNAKDLPVYWATTPVTNVANISELKSKHNPEDESLVFRLTGSAYVSYNYVDGNKTYIYIQDENSGISIYDAFGDISRSYKTGDEINNITGKLNKLFGSMFFVPSIDLNEALSENNTIEPIVVTLAQLKENALNYESRLIKVSNVEFYNRGNENDGIFTEGTNNKIKQGASEASMRVFKGVDYLGDAIPETADIVGISTSYAGNLIAPRSKQDIIYSQTTPLKADFTASEAQKEVYRQGFDSETEIAEWTIHSTNADYTWHLANSKKQGLSNFNTIDNSSLFSAAVFFDDKVEQNEELVSPYFNIKSGSVCRFYAAFDGVFAYWAKLILEIEDKETETRVELFNSFKWSNETGHERHEWLPFEFDLSDYTGREVRFIFTYKGIDGDDAYIDNFCILESDTSEEAKVYINEGETIHFLDLSTGAPESWEWSFEGGNITTSTDKNPEVRYDKAGVYNVSLKVNKGDESDEITKTAYVNVKGVAPKANFDFPTEAYLSPEAAMYIPINQAVSFTDKSSGKPTTWQWNFPGAVNTSSSEQNPSVEYTEKGLYSMGLTVSNSVGSNTIEYRDAIQVGDTCSVWNIYIDESSSLSAIELGWYGFYGGSNWLGMSAFAEKYKKPLADAYLSSVDIYFYDTKTVLEPVDITVNIMSDKDGLPHEILASSTLSSDKLKYDPEVWVPTTFTFEQPLEIKESFYVAVHGIPNRTDDDTSDSDEIVIGSVRRNADSERISTAYHLLEDEDENYQPLGTYTWYLSEDENVSMSIAPRLTYDKKPESIRSVENDGQPNVYTLDRKLYVSGLEGSYDVNIYNVSGSLIANHKQVANPVDLPNNNGMYLVIVKQNNQKWAFRIAE